MTMFAERIDRETWSSTRGRADAPTGCREGLDPELRRRDGVWAEKTTAANERITLFVAFNYGKAEIVDAARTFSGETEEEFRRRPLRDRHVTYPDFDTHEAELRISNYRSAGAVIELRFATSLHGLLAEAAVASLDEYEARKRRFGAQAAHGGHAPGAPASGPTTDARGRRAPTDRGRRPGAAYPVRGPGDPVRLLHRHPGAARSMPWVYSCWVWWPCTSCTCLLGRASSAALAGFITLAALLVACSTASLAT